ncbi:MAG: septum formation initiator family protein [Verrucomicrobia bacterium]|nr:septum formation initiator family protein [Verrucomicrobiota bacterium]
MLLSLAALIAVGMWYVPLIEQNQRMRTRILQLDQQIEYEMQRSNELVRAINALRTDPETVERLAREKLGYSKPGETVIHFELSPTNRAFSLE